MRQPEQRSAYFADLEAGQDWGIHHWTLTPQFARGWSEVTGDDFPVYHDSAETRAVYGAPLAPPGIAFIFLTEAIQALMPNRAPGGVHVRQALRFLAPIHVGDTLGTTLTIVRKYLKRERKYVEMQTVTRNQRGKRVLEGFRVTLWAA